MKKSIKTICILSGILAFLIAGILFFNFRYPTRYYDEIIFAADEFGVERELLAAIIWTESKFDKDAKSSKGAEGLMQIKPETAKWCVENCYSLRGCSPPYSTSENIRIGAMYYKYLRAKFDEADALAAYNAGEGNVKKWKEQGIFPYPYSETVNYVKRVSRAKKIYKIRYMFFTLGV